MHRSCLPDPFAQYYTDPNTESKAATFKEGLAKLTLAPWVTFAVNGEEQRNISDDRELYCSRHVMAV